MPIAKILHLGHFRRKTPKTSSNNVEKNDNLSGETTTLNPGNHAVRWPLRNQILIRMLILLLIIAGAITFANIRSIITSNREAELSQLQRLVKLVTTSRFPLTSSVLESMKSLSGADFLLVDSEGMPVAQTSAAPNAKLLKDFQTATDPAKVTLEGNSFYHTAVDNFQGGTPIAAAKLLHILVPRQSEQSIWWEASKSPMLIALLVLPLMFLFSLALANQVTRPLNNLKNQVQQIAQGNVKQIPEIKSNDEIRDLNISINEMAIKLGDHETQLRKNERLRTMVQFGSSIAHHLRNSATGCKMAVELLAVDHREIASSDDYQVAIRQLGLMNNYIKKFLLLSKSSDKETVEEVPYIQLAPILENVVFLVSPSAKHLNVELSIKSNCDDSKIKMPEEDAEQMMMNLITNAITAASERGANLSSREQAFVSIDLLVKNGGVKFSVTDSGAGPPVDIADSIFQPFVTGSKEGTGLGLSLVREIAERADGQVQWTRSNGATTFSFETPETDSPNNEIAQ